MIKIDIIFRQNQIPTAIVAHTYRIRSVIKDKTLKVLPSATVLDVQTN